jgi:amidohydrolase
MNVINQIKNAVEFNFNEIVEIRRYLHQYPELSFSEFETSKYVQQKLTEFGIEFKAGYVKTGIVGLIKGKNPDSKVIALRADLDALPILEENEVSYCSKNEGVMHACGHDVHTASLLGAAKVLNELKDNFEGSIKLIFQPGEEVLPGGAKLMIEEKVLENPTPSRVLGQHVYPEMEVGKIGVKSGMYMASADEIYVTVKGKGGHAALPHQVIDPILIASHIIVSLQQIVSRNGRPDIPTVLSFGNIVGKGATNIIPNEVKLEGTFRTMDEEWRAKAHILMVEMAENIAKAMGGECEFNVIKGYPFLTNEEKTTACFKNSAIEYLGKENVVDLGLRMTAEDFAYYSQIAATCFYRLGVKNEEKKIVSNLHTSTFNIDENALKIGAGLMAYSAIKQLENISV